MRVYLTLFIGFMAASNTPNDRQNIKVGSIGQTRTGRAGGGGG